MEDLDRTGEESIRDVLSRLYETIDQEGYSVAFYNSFKTYFECCMMNLPKDDIDTMGDYEYMKTSLLTDICARGMELCDELDLGLEITYIPFLTTSINILQAMAYLNALHSNFFSPEEIRSFRYSLSPFDMLALKRNILPFSYRNDVMERFERFKESSGLVDEVIFDKDGKSQGRKLSTLWISQKGYTDETSIFERFLPRDLFDLYSYLSICFDSLTNVGHQINALNRGVLKNLVANAYLIATQNIAADSIYDFGEYFKNDSNYNKVMDRFEQYGQDFNKVGRILRDVDDEIGRNMLETVLDAMYSNLLIETHSLAASNGSSLQWISRYAFCIDRLLILFKNLDTDGEIFHESNESIVRKLLETNVDTGLTKDEEVNPADHGKELSIDGIDEARKILKSWNMPEGVIDANIDYIISKGTYMDCLDVLEQVYVPDDIKFIQIIISGIIMDVAMGRLLPNEKLSELIEVLKNTLKLKTIDPLS